MTGFAGRMSGPYDAVVVGAGVVGLTCAVRLAGDGARVAVLTGDDPAATVSRVAAAVWYPTHTDPASRVLRWAARTAEVFAGQASAGVPGVVLRPTRMLLRIPPAGPPWWAHCVPDFRTGPGLPAPYVGQWLFTAATVEMDPYLDWLLGELATRGGVLLRRRLDRLDEAAGLAPVVVNATGLGARVLAGDEAVHPVRGRVVLVANPGLRTSVRDEDAPGGPTYVHPRSRDVVLGGTYEPGEAATGPDPAAVVAIMARCAALVPEVAGAPVTGERVGLRPGRVGGPRVALDPLGLPGGTRLVHSYGHGGAGMTLSWGCADEVAELVAAG